MPQEELGVDRQQQLADFVPALALDPHVEIARDMQGLELVPPGEAEMVVAPAAANRQVDLVLARTLEGPTILLNGMLKHVERVFEGLGWGLGGKLHLWPLLS